MSPKIITSTHLNHSAPTAPTALLLSKPRKSSRSSCAKSKSIGLTHPHHGAPDSQPIPDGGTLARATFDLQLPHDLHPHRISLQPPDNLIVESPADAPRVLPWLERCRFRLPRNLANAIALFLIIASTALPPAFDDQDDDDDERDPERHAQTT